MLKILVVIVVLSLLFIWIKADRKAKIMKNNESPDNKNDDKKKNQIPKSDMIECSKCSTYIPISDAVMSNGKYLCPNNCE